jgi:hypothetical protein
MAWMRAHEARNPRAKKAISKAGFFRSRLTLYPGSFRSSLKRADQSTIDRVDYRHRLPVGFPVSTMRPPDCTCVDGHASNFLRPTPRNEGNSAVARVTHVKARHKILEVGREEVPLACFASRVQVGANLDLLRTSPSISGAKAKNLTLRHPMKQQFACSRPQPSVLYFRSAERRTTRSKLNVRGANAADERHWRVDSST